MSARDLIIQRLENDVAVVSLVGDHDTFSADRVAREVHALLDEGFDVQIDLREATFVDSTTVGALIEAHRHALELGRRFMVVIGDTTGWAVRRLFELTQLDSYLTLSGDGS
jgi:anti-sigma B factor antagonist